MVFLSRFKSGVKAKVALAPNFIIPRTPAPRAVSVEVWMTSRVSTARNGNLRSPRTGRKVATRAFDCRSEVSPSTTILLGVWPVVPLELSTIAGAEVLLRSNSLKRSTGNGASASDRHSRGPPHARSTILAYSPQRS